MGKRMSKDKGMQRLHTVSGQRGAVRQTIDPITLGTDGSILINAAHLTTPSVVYDADVAWAKRRYGAVSLFFAKIDLDKANTLHSRLELRYPDELFVEHFVKNAEEFRARVREVVQKFHTDDSRPEIDYSRLPTERSHSQWVNFDHIARAGTQASLDFYHLSPSGIAKYVQKQGSDSLEITPCVRVLTTTREVLRLLDEAAEMAAQMKPLLPEDLRVNRAKG